MTIKEKLGNISSFDSGEKAIDVLCIEWYEANKRIMHKKTNNGLSVSLKFLNDNPDFKDGDVIYTDEKNLVIINIIPCDVIIIKPCSIIEAASACYEIGNKHLPLYYEGDELLVPYDASLMKLLHASGFNLARDERILNYAVKTSVVPHAHSAGSSLFNKILQITKS